MASVCSLNSYAQYEHHTYDSLYSPFSGYSGHANFEYLIGSKGEHIKEGSFTFDSKIIDSTCGLSVQHMVWKGDYHKNHKVNDWEYTTVSNDLKLIDINDDFELKYDLYSVKEILKGQFENGKPHGKWRLEREILKDREAYRMIRSIRANMGQSKFFGNVEIFGFDDNEKPYSIEGEAEKGLMVEEWIFEYFEGNRKIYETRYYDRGFLLTLTKTDHLTGDIITELQFPLSKPLQSYLREEGSEKAVNRPLSLTYNDGYPRNSNYLSAQSNANKLIDQAMDDFFKFEQDYFESNGLPVGTNRLYYPLSPEEKEVLKKWSALEFKLRDRIAALVELKDANFKYNNNDTLNRIDEWVDQQGYLLSYIKPWNQIIAHEEIVFYNRRDHLFDYASQLLQADTLSSEGNTSIIRYESDKEVDSSFLFYVVNNFESRIEMADSMLTKYKRIIEQLNLANEVLLQGKQIILLKTHLDSIYTSMPNDVKQMKQLTEAIKQKHLTSSYQSKYKEFIQFEGPVEEHKEKGDSLVFNLRSLKDTYFTIEDIFYTVNTIDTLYTEYVFDAYTFNDRFPKRIKKKLYQFVMVDLFKDLLNLAAEQSNPVQLRATLNHIRGLQERMIFLADKDTGKLERKLRKNQTLDKRLEIMKIE